VDPRPRGDVAAGSADDGSTAARRNQRCPAVRSLGKTLDSALSGHRVPGVAAAVSRTDCALAEGAAGVRRLGGTDSVRSSDRFHIGSVTKPFTATIAGLLVARGQLQWRSKLLDVVPSLRRSARRAYDEVTLADLLSHESGLPPFTDDSAIQSTKYPGTPSEQRLAFVSTAVAQPPIGPRGTFNYSNAGFAAAAVMMETRTGRPWEGLIRDLVFSRLGLKTAVVGWPGLAADPGDPWGHLEDSAGTLVPQDPAGPYRLPAFVAPAGDVAMSMPDLATFLRAHLRALQGSGEFLPPDLVRQMHTRRTRSGLGFGVGEVRGIAPVSTYAGSAGTFLCVIAIAPTRDVAVAVAVNAATPAADSLAKALLGNPLLRFGAEARSVPR
jgi:CubicO group peptidase (beta-lactamase class C family)